MKGPVSVAIDASSDYFQLYQSGILTNASACGQELNHAVTVVGYSSRDVETPYWIVRNSWSALWGDQGYVNIAITDGYGVCGINQAATYPNLLIEPESAEFWTIVGCMSFALFGALPFAAWKLRQTQKEGILHPVEKPFIKTLVFEGVFFSLCWAFYAMSDLTAFTNYQFKEMCVFAFYCTLHLTFLSLHNCLAISSRA
jgi:hypothetical protein